MIGNTITYDNLDMEIRPAQGPDYALSVRSRAGETDGTFCFPYDKSALEISLLNLKLALRQAGSFRRVISSEQQEVQKLGAALFDALMVDEARGRYDLSREKAEQEEHRLRIRLHIASPELAVLPWEYLYDRRENCYLSLSTRTPVVRYLKLPRPPRPLDVTPPLRILGLSACPVGLLPPLNLDQEHQRMEAALAGLIRKDYFNIHWAEDHTWRGLQKILRSGPWHIFHFFGHGGFDREKDEGFIVLENERREAERLYASGLGQMLADHPTLRLAFLNACEGAEGGTHDIFSSTASILIQRGLPAVLAMQYNISDQAAIELASTFYEALADGYPVDAALTEARKAVYIALPSSMEWGVPALHLRAPSGDLFHLEGEPSFSVKPSQVGARLISSYESESGPVYVSTLTRQGTPTPDRPTLSGYFVSPILALQAMEHRIGRGDIRQVIPSPNRRVIVIAGGGAAMFDLRTGQAHWEIDAPSIRGTLSPDGRILALAAGSVIELWDLVAGTYLHALTGHTDWVRSMAFNSNMRLLASGGSDSTVRVWDLQDNHLLGTIDGQAGWVNSVAFSPDGRLLAFGANEILQLWDVDRLRLWRRLEGHTDRVYSVVFSLDGRTLASSSRDHTVCLWNLGHGTLLRRWDKHGRPVYSVTFGHDERTLASGSEDGTICLWNVERSEPVHVLQGHTSRVSSVAFSPDENTLVSGSFDGTVRLWDAQRGIPLHTMASHSFGVRSIAFSSDGHILASGCEDGTICLWRIDEGSLIRAIQSRAGVVTSIAFSLDGHAIASGGDGVVRLWDAFTGATWCSLEGHAGQVNSVAFSVDGTVLASGGSDSAVRFWNVPDGTLADTWHGHTGGVRSIAFGPDGYTVAADNANTICLWDMASAQVLRSLDGHTGRVNSIAFSPNGRILASGSDDQTICLWNLDAGAAMHILKGHANWICCVAFSPDGCLLASGSADGTVCLWNVASGDLLHTIEGHSRPVRGVAFHPDGHLLATASDDGIIRLWRTD